MLSSAVRLGYCDNLPVGDFPTVSYLDPVVKMKWNTSNISLFLKVYQQFPTLWNFKDKDYTNKSLTYASCKRLMSELKESQLGETDAKLLKSTKDVYRTELQKIEKNVKERLCN